MCFSELAANCSLRDSSRADWISAVPGNSGRLGGDTKEDRAVLEPNDTVFDDASEILDEVDVLTAGTLRLLTVADPIECGTGKGNASKFCFDTATVLLIDEFTGLGKLGIVEVLGATLNPLDWPAETGFGKDGPFWGNVPATVLLIDEFTGLGKLGIVEVLGATPNPLDWPAETGFGKDGPFWGNVPAKLWDGFALAATGKGSWESLWADLKIKYLEEEEI